MSVYEKLQKSRIELQKLNLKKSGKNKFSGYDYFELSDILPSINEIFYKNKLCSVVSFNAENAILKVVDIEKPDNYIEFESPMADASLKGCHAIQNLGAVETYQRRYLYMTALEVTEHDVLDATTNKPDKKSDDKPVKTFIKKLDVKDANTITDKQAKYLFAKSNEAGLTHDDLKALIKSQGYESTKDIHRDEFNTVLQLITERAETPF